MKCQQQLRNTEQWLFKMLSFLMKIDTFWKVLNHIFEHSYDNNDNLKTSQVEKLLNKKYLTTDEIKILYEKYKQIITLMRQNTFDITNKIIKDKIEELYVSVIKDIIIEITNSNQSPEKIVYHPQILSADNKKFKLFFYYFYLYKDSKFFNPAILANNVGYNGIKISNTLHTIGTTITNKYEKFNHIITQLKNKCNIATKLIKHSNQSEIINEPYFCINSYKEGGALGCHFDPNCNFDSTKPIYV